MNLLYRIGRKLGFGKQRLVSSLQALWHRLPVPARARHRIKSLIFRAAAPVFRGTQAYSAWIEQSRWIEQGKHITSSLDIRALAELRIENRSIPESVGTQPLVSIVIPVYNKLTHTLACLDSIARHMPKESIEVLVIDDGSMDATESSLSTRTDIRYLRNRENLGFVGSCNHGAENARGEFLFFLNNDTIVLDGWLDASIQTFRDVPDVGVVGSKLIYPDGRLQEAGGIVWADASCWNRGRLADPAAPEFNFRCDVDYCSGAALLIRRDLFNTLRGFDERYAPGYYEDTDLAFSVREHGLRVLYQPLSQIIHYEGVSAGTSLTSGMKAHQVRNRHRFQEKWAHVLAGYSGYRSRACARMLVIDACTPTPDQDSGSLDMLNYLRLLIGFGYHVTFIPASNLLHFGRYTTALQSIGVECLYRPYIQSVQDVLKQRGEEFDAVMLVRVTVAFDLIDQVTIHCPRARVLFNTVDLHFVREQRLAELETGQASSPRSEDLRRQELAVIARADVTIVISPVEQVLLAHEAPGARVRVIPILREIPGRSADFDQRTGLVFVGGFRHPPNIDAMLWFCAEIWPAIRRAIPEITLSIIGSHMVPEVRALQGDGIQVLGFVEDLMPVFARARVSVAPLRYGAGQKGKVVTSLSYGVPCVLTPIAAEGLGLTDEQGITIAETPTAFADAVFRVYHDPVLWERLSEKGLKQVEREFSLIANRDRLASLLREIELPIPDKFE